MKKLLLLFFLLPLISTAQQKFTSSGAGLGFSYLIDSLGNMWATGNNINGQLGLGHKQDRLVFTQVQGSDWATVEASISGAYAIKKDGSLWYMGSIYPNPETSTPKQIGKDKDWKSLAVGRQFVILLKKDGSLWSYGDNSQGQLGFPGSSNSSPEQIGTDQWIAVAAGDKHVLAIKKDGSLWSWGSGKYGALGLNSETDVYQPTLIDDIDFWAAVSANSYFSHAQTAQGELYAWGLNDKGQLGIGNRETQLQPVRVNLPEPVKMIANGGAHALAIGLSGKLYGWGENQYGQLGKFSAGQHLSPMQIGVDSSWVNVNCAFGFTMGSGAFQTGNHSIGIKNNGQKACLTGFNGDGELGTGNITTQYSFNCLTSLTTNIEKLISTSVSLYPNPASKRLILDFTDAIEVSDIRVMDQLGREIPFTLSKNNFNLVLDVEKIKSGIYSLRLQLPNGEIINKSFIKQ